MKLFNTPQKRYKKLRTKYLQAVQEYAQLQLLFAERPFLSEKEFNKIQARIAKLNKEIDQIKNGLGEFKPKMDGDQGDERDSTRGLGGA